MWILLLFVIGQSQVFPTLEVSEGGWKIIQIVPKQPIVVVEAYKTTFDIENEKRITVDGHEVILHEYVGEGSAKKRLAIQLTPREIKKLKIGDVVLTKRERLKLIKHKTTISIGNNRSQELPLYRVDNKRK